MQYDYEKQPDKLCSKCKKEAGTYLIVSGHGGCTEGICPLFCIQCCEKVKREIKTGRTSVKDVYR